MKERLEKAKARLAELEKIGNPDEWQRGSMVYLREAIAHLERMTTAER